MKGKQWMEIRNDRLKEYQRKSAEFYGHHFDENDYICCCKTDGNRFGLGYLNTRLAKDLTRGFSRLSPSIN